MAAPSFGVGWLEVLFILLGGSGLLGMPPGERDALLLKAAPQQTLLYFEWAGRGAGQPGAAGIDGLVPIRRSGHSSRLSIKLSPTRNTPTPTKSNSVFKRKSPNWSS